MALYDAFISYSHANDKPIAAALQSVIQKLGKHWYQRRALRVFRDDTSLSATPHLWPTIESALGQSRYFVLLASPEAAASKWVNKEVMHWLDHNSIDTLLIGLTDGELAWDEATGDFAAHEAKPLPSALAGRFPVEPKWVDLRAYRDGANASNARFADLGANFAAAIRGMPKEDLLSLEVRQQRRALTLAWSAAGSLAVLIALAGWQWWEAESAKRTALASERVATEQKDVAETQRDRAEKALGAATRIAHKLVFDLLEQSRPHKAPKDRTSDTAFRFNIIQAVIALEDELRRGGQTNPELRHAEVVALREYAAALTETKDFSTALANASRSLQMMEELAAEYPSNIRWQQELSLSYDKMSEALVAAGRRQDAFEYVKKRAAVLERLAEADIGDIGVRRDLVINYRSQAEIHLQNDRLDEAVGASARSLLVAAKLDAGDAGNTMVLRDLAETYHDIAVQSVGSNRLDEALKSHLIALEVMVKLAIADASHKKWNDDVEFEYGAMMRVIQMGGRKDAIERLREVVPMFEKLAAVDRRNIDWPRILSSSHRRIGDFLMEAGQQEEARAAYHKSFAINERVALDNPADPGGQLDLVIGLYRLADAGDEPRPRLTRALEILRQLDARGALSANQKAWFRDIERRLATLPPEQAEAR